MVGRHQVSRHTDSFQHEKFSSATRQLTLCMTVQVAQVCRPEGANEHGGCSGFQQARHVLDAEGVDAMPHQLICQLQIVLQVILHHTYEAGLATIDLQVRWADAMPA